MIASDTTGLNFDLQPSSLHPCPLMGLHFSTFPHSPHFFFFKHTNRFLGHQKTELLQRSFQGEDFQKKKKSAVLLPSVQETGDFLACPLMFDIIFCVQHLFMRPYPLSNGG